MININTNRWQSGRLLFDKHIIGGNRKSNYQWQQSEWPTKRKTEQSPGKQREFIKWFG